MIKTLNDIDESFEPISGLDKYNNSADKLLDDLFQLSKNKNSLIYRGIRHIDEIYPTIMRVKIGDKYKNVHFSEIPMLKEFRKHSIMLLEGQYGPIDFVSWAQHYGIPTRLLDWTSDPFVALYFAIYKDLTENNTAPEFGFRLLACNKWEQIVINDLGYRSTWGDAEFRTGEPLIETYQRFVKDIRKSDGLRDIMRRFMIKGSGIDENRFIILEPNRSNPRLTAQKGLFVIPKSRNKQLIYEEYRAARVKMIYIDRKIRQQLLTQLENLGYSKLNLFFDLQNIAEYIRDKTLGL